VRLLVTGWQAMKHRSSYSDCYRLSRSFPICAVLLFVLLLSRSLAIQSYLPTRPDPVLESWRWRSFPELKGLGLRCMAEDRDGRMWFGTDDGVRCYDGMDWTAYTPENGLPGAPVNELYAGENGSVYAGSDWGIDRFDEGVWTRVFPVEEDLPWPIDRILEGADGSIWAATAWGILHLDEGGPLLYTSADMGAALSGLAPELPLHIVPEQTIPLRSWGEGVGVRVVQGRNMSTHRGSAPMVVWALAPGGPGETAGLRVGDHILAVNGDRPQQPYLILEGPAGVSLSLLVQRSGEQDPFVVELTRVQLEGGVRSFSISDICEDREKRIWCGFSWGGEILRVRLPGDWRLYTEADGLDTGFSPGIAESQDGAIWTISNSRYGTVNRFHRGVWTHFSLTEKRGTDNNTSILGTADGTLWIGDHGGKLHAVRDTGWTCYEASSLPVPQVRIIDLLETADGALWMAPLGGEAVRLDYGTTRWATYQGLNLSRETVDGDLWFVGGDSMLVRFDGKGWTRFDTGDGLMLHPEGLMMARDGSLWAVGRHNQQAAVARFAETEVPPWSLELYPRLGRSIDYNGVIQTADGALWFGASDVRPEHLGGVLRFDGVEWQHYTAPEALLHLYAVAQTLDGTLWSGGPSLRRFDGRTWTSVTEPKALTSWIHDMCVAANGDLWVATRTYGVMRFDGENWTRYGVQEGLAGNQVDAIRQTADGSIWAATHKGYSRFDGSTWVARVIPALQSDGRRGGLRQARDGALWIDQSNMIIRYRPDADSPRVEMALSLDEVSQPGNTLLSWRGADPWGDTPEAELHYSWRLDGGEWSSFAPETNQIFLSLASGSHLFEVKARDRDFNEDPTPTQVHFTVVPPVWQQPWFLGLMALLLGAIGFQTVRVVRRDRRLVTANEALRREISEREKLDTQLRQLRYLYRLRSALSAARSVDEAIRATGEVIMEVLGVMDSGEVRIECDDRTWTFGDGEVPGKEQYERPLSWGDKERGRFCLFCGIALSESQERALLDETAGQLVQVLETRELEMQILQSARLVSLGEMAAGVAHELNQPLTVISGVSEDLYLRLVEDLDISPEQLQQKMKDVMELAQRMAGSIDHLRVFSRDTSAEPGIVFSINDVVHSSLRMIEAQLVNHGVSLHLDLAEELPMVSGHPHQLEQVLLNLLANGRDALDEKWESIPPGAREKSLEVRTRHEIGGGEWVIAEVEDGGAGMDEASVRRIFEPFFTTKEADRGTGLGLSISYAIVKNHDGQITCQSRKGEGTVFRVVLPVAGEG